MKLLLCSDGTDAAAASARLAALLARTTKSEIALLGIAEGEQDEAPLRKSLTAQAAEFGSAASPPRLVIGHGEPIQGILAETKSTKYDLVLIGARQVARSGPRWRSERMYEIIKAIEPPVLVALGECQRLSRFLVCTGGKKYIDAAVRLTAELAAALHAEVTLLHIMPEPPAIYEDLAERERDVDALLGSNSELGRNLTAQKKALEKMGVKVQVRVRQGSVLEQIFREVFDGDYDLVVTGSSRARGPLRHYIMGDITRSILNRAECPVLVARSDVAAAPGGFWPRVRALFGAGAA